MRELNLPAHFRDHIPAHGRQGRALVSPIGLIDSSLYDSSLLQAAENVRSRVAIHADFRRERHLVHSRFLEEDLHHARLYRCRPKLPAILHVNGDKNLMKAPHQKSGTSRQCGRERGISHLILPKPKVARYHPPRS